MDKTRTIGQKWLINELVLLFGPSKVCRISFQSDNSTRRKMDIQDQYLDIQLCDNHLTYSVLISKYSAVISKIFILTYFNISDSKAKCLDITTEYTYIFLRVSRVIVSKDAGKTTERQTLS